MNPLIVLTMLVPFLAACDSVPKLAQATPTQPAPTATAESKSLPPQGKPITLPALSPQGKQGTLTAQPQAKNGTPPAPQGKQGTPGGTGATAQPTSETQIVNPTSGAKLYVAVYAPKNASGKSPAVVLVPGGIGDSSRFTSPNPRDIEVLQYTNAGFVAIVFDPDGRGKSEGNEDLDGTVHQDGLAAVIRYAATLPQVDAKQIGVLTFSYGIVMGSGALARHSDLPVKYLVDWEGPAERNDMTADCRGGGGTGSYFHSCADNAWWSEREAVNFVGRLRVAYQRVQTQNDHAQPDVSHAIKMINAAVKGGAPFVRLNDYPANQQYDVNKPPAMLSDTLDTQYVARIIQYAQELMRK